ncbi:GH3 auxin-responsive promoter family protein [Chroococcidiopsis cubana]|uniref:GH3 family domain-containing protein n=1 Tax=Chroococcidiopsis cubana TaxID=171392 RepID=UPI0038FD1D8C
MGEKNLEDIRNDTLKCSEVQQTLLQSILASQQYTEYGKKYHFKNIQTIEELSPRAIIVSKIFF